MKPPLYPPGTTVYWPRAGGSIIIATVAHVQCHPVHEGNRFCPGPLPAYCIYALTNSAGGIYERELYATWEAALAALNPLSS